MHEVIGRTREFVREYMSNFDSSHDYLHCLRVETLALSIAEKTAVPSYRGPVDRELVRMAALCHDVNDPKYQHKTSLDGFLKTIGYQNAPLLLNIISRISYRKELEEPDYIHELIMREKQGFVAVPYALELCIVQDADRLDAIGAIGTIHMNSVGS